MILCTCCQSELTSPQFYNGLPYGPVCVKRIDPSFKTVARKYIKVDSFTVSASTDSSRKVYKFKIGSKSMSVAVYGDLDKTAHEQGGALYVNASAIKL